MKEFNQIESSSFDTIIKNIIAPLLLMIVPLLMQRYGLLEAQ